MSVTPIREQILREVYHDHEHFGRMFQDLRERFGRVVTQDLSLTEHPDVLQMAMEDLAFLIDEMMEHFEFEEQHVFKLIIEKNPESETEIKKLQASHDKICSDLARLNSMMEQPAETVEGTGLKIYDSLLSLSKVIEKHGHEEDHLFAHVVKQLSDEECEELTEVMKSA